MGPPVTAPAAVKGEPKKEEPKKEEPKKEEPAAPPQPAPLPQPVDFCPITKNLAAGNTGYGPKWHNFLVRSLLYVRKKIDIQIKWR